MVEVEVWGVGIQVSYCEFQILSRKCSVPIIIKSYIITHLLYKIYSKAASAKEPVFPFVTYIVWSAQVTGLFSPKEISVVKVGEEGCLCVCVCQWIIETRGWVIIETKHG